MIPACVIDASVAIKWVISEDGAEAADRLRRSGTALHAPELIVPETGNILWKKVRRGELTETEAEVACGILLLARIALHAMAPHAQAGLRLATALEHPVYDTTYLALAQALGVPMVTADRRLAARLARAEGMGLPEVVPLPQ